MFLIYNNIFMDKGLIKKVEGIITEFITNSEHILKHIKERSIEEIQKMCDTYNMNYNNIFPAASKDWNSEKVFPQSDLTSGKVDKYAQEEGLSIDDIIKHWPGEYKIIFKKAHPEGLDISKKLIEHYNTSFFTALLNYLNKYLYDSIGQDFVEISPELLHYYIYTKALPTEYLVRVKQDLKNQTFKILTNLENEI